MKNTSMNQSLILSRAEAAEFLQTTVGNLQHYLSSQLFALQGEHRLHKKVVITRASLKEYIERRNRTSNKAKHINEIDMLAKFEVAIAPTKNVLKVTTTPEPLPTSPSTPHPVPSPKKAESYLPLDQAAKFYGIAHSFLIQLSQMKVIDAVLDPQKKTALYLCNDATLLNVNAIVQAKGQKTMTNIQKSNPVVLKNNSKKNGPITVQVVKHFHVEGRVFSTEEEANEYAKCLNFVNDALWHLDEMSRGDVANALLKRSQYGL